VKSFAPALSVSHSLPLFFTFSSFFFFFNNFLKGGKPPLLPTKRMSSSSSNAFSGVSSPPCMAPPGCDFFLHYLFWAPTNSLSSFPIPSPRNPSRRVAVSPFLSHTTSSSSLPCGSGGSTDTSLWPGGRLFPVLPSSLTPTLQVRTPHLTPSSMFF